MQPCPNCGQEVLQMAKSCRHCGTELDEETLFLNEGKMVDEIMALQKEVEANETGRNQRQKAVKVLSGLAIVALIPGVGLSVAAEGTMELVGYGFIVGSVILALLALKNLKDLKALG